MTTPDWKKRTTRARELAQEDSGAKELLRFYAPLLEFQAGVYETVRARKVERERPLRAQLDPCLLVPLMPELLAVAETHGTSQLRDSARGLKRQGEPRWRELLLDYIGGQAEGGEIEEFFARACVEPYAEHLASQTGARSPLTSASCLACAGKPMFAVLRPEGDGAKRSLVCSFCLTEWEFRRLLCPSCGEDKEANLPVFTSEGLPYVRVETCDICRHYILAIDLTKNGLAVPLVDQVAAAPLDLWASEKGYSKLATHLLGL